MGEVFEDAVENGSLGFGYCRAVGGLKVRIFEWDFRLGIGVSFEGDIVVPPCFVSLGMLSV